MKVVMIFPGIMGYRLSLSRALAATKRVELIVVTDEQSEIDGDDSSYRIVIAFRLVGRRLDGRLTRKLGIRKLANLCLGIAGVARSVTVCLRERPDIVHVQGLLYVEPFCVLCIACIKALGFSVVFTPHNAGPRNPRPGMDLMWTMLFRMSDRIVAHSNAAARRFSSVYGVAAGKVEIIPFANYDVTANAMSAGDRQEARYALGLSATESIVLFFGQVRPYKGLEFLIEALPQVLRHIPNVQLMVVGRAPDGFDAYDRLIHSLGIQNQTITRTDGWIEAKDHAKYFVACDVVVLPYRDLPEIDTSAVAAEALSFGRAVIASDVGGIAEQVIDGVTGIKVPPENVDALAAAIWQLLQDPGRRHLMERAALERAKQLSWRPFAERTLDAYEIVKAARRSVDYQ